MKLRSEILLRYRNGVSTKDDIDLINERVHKPYRGLPNDIRYAVYTNRDRDSINTGVFMKRCRNLQSDHEEIRDTIVILSSEIEIKDGNNKYQTVRNPLTFWEGCGESDVEPCTKYGRMDPLVKLYHLCPMMLTCNSNVANGKAKGSQVQFLKCVLKHSAKVRVVEFDGVFLNCVFAHEVEHIVCQHVKHDIQPRQFQLKPEKYSFRANVPVPGTNEKNTVNMRAVQIPNISNTATTGHKLQGSGVKNLFISVWSTARNWNYVMLSRVTTPLPYNSAKKPPQSLVDMMQSFETHSPTFCDEDLETFEAFYENLLEQEAQFKKFSLFASNQPTKLHEV